MSRGWLCISRSHPLARPARFDCEAGSARSTRGAIVMAESAHGVAPDGMKKRDEDSDDGMEFSPFWGIEKGAVLQEARCFNESQLDARRCQQVITKLLYLLNQGETFTKVRARHDDRDERRRTRAPLDRSRPSARSQNTRRVARGSRSRVPRTRFFFFR